MSIKFLQDQQLNQIQRSPMDSPWAKLVAQSELLDRSKLRQPQGQAPQGTVADDIQQALLAAQQNQAQQMQNVPLDKAQLIAQLVNSGHFAAGGLTQSSPYSQMIGSSPYNAAGHAPTYIPPESQDAAAQEKKHGILQTLLDNSMYSGKGTIGSNLQMYSDMLTGKLFSRGFAEGGDIQGYARGGTIAEQLEALRPYITGDKGWTPEAIANYKSAYQKQWGTGSSNRFPATTQQLPSYEDLLELQRRRLAQTGLNIRDPNTIEIAPTRQPEIVPRSEPTPQAAQLVDEANPYRQAAEDRAARLRAVQQAAANTQRVLPAPGPTSASNLEAMLGGNSNVQDFIDSLKSKQLTATTPRASSVPEGTSNLPATRTGVNLPAEIGSRGATIEAPYFVHPNATPNANAAAQSAWQEAEMLGRNKARWDQGQSPEAKAWLEAQQIANKPQEGKPPAVYDPMQPGATTLEEIAAKAKQGLGSFGEAAKAVGRPVLKAASALSPIGDIMMAGDITGNPSPLIAKALGVNAPESVAQGSLSSLFGDLSKKPDLSKYLAGAKPSVPQVDLSQYGVDINDKIPGQPTVQDFSKGAPYANAATQKPSVSTGTTINKVPQTAKAPITDDNAKVINATHGQDTQPTSNPVVNAATTHAAVAQADQAVSKSAGEEGQGSILDSLYNKLKDTDVDYSDLAKRISQNEYDLARERKDGTFNAILGGIGAALKQAGTYEEAGGRVFKPGIGAIAGSGILGGLKLSEEADRKYAEGNQNNTLALLKLKELKGKSLNDVLDAISAQQQTQAIARGQEITRAHYGDVAAHQARQDELKAEANAIQARNFENAHQDRMAQIEILAKKNPAQANKIRALGTILSNNNRALSRYNFDPTNPVAVQAQADYDAALSELSALANGIGVGDTSGAGAPQLRNQDQLGVINVTKTPK